jgi:3,4-dihydroxy 2-butanone 4-phosphate synthase/GTP cyclohydrolase II
VERVVERQVDTEFGSFRLVVYRDLIENCTHSALIYGEISPDEPVLVRVHVPNVLTDVFAMRGTELGLPLRVAFREITNAGSGVVVILGDTQTTEDLPDRLAEMPPRTVRRGDSRSAGELRTYGIGAQVLADLGVRKMRVLSAPKRFHGLAGFGLEVVEYVEPAQE